MQFGSHADTNNKFYKIDFLQNLQLCDSNNHLS